MKVEAHSLFIENLLKKGKYIIPDYQREFDWDRENIIELIEDLKEISPDENYFIGHMVFEGEFNGKNFYVIDGQQRITIITILLCVIRDLLISIDEINLADAIHNGFIFGKDRENAEYVVLESKMPYPILQKLVQSKPQDKDKKAVARKNGEKKIEAAYNLIKNEFENFTKKELIVFRDKILNLEVIFVAASDQVDATTIFMTLNATGKDLTPLDLVKNQIFSLYPKQSHINEPNDTWKYILNNTSGSSKFLNNFFASRFKKVSDKRIFKEFLKEIKNKKSDYIKIFLSNLKDDSLIYKKIVKPNLSDWNTDDYEVYESIRAITKLFKIEVANSFLISLIRDYQNSNISKVYFLKALSAIERFHFINNAICSNRSSGFDVMYAKYAKDLYTAKDKQEKHIIIDIIYKYLISKIPNYQLFEGNFDNKLYYLEEQSKQKPLVQYVLIKLERKANPNAILNKISIEHIYPESNEKWEELKDMNLVKNLGNLVLLDSNLNSRIGNKIYTVKKELIHNKSKLLTTKETFTINEIWSDSQIIKRRDDLVGKLYNDIWL